MKKFSCYDKKGSMVGEFRAKDEKSALENAKKLNPAIESVVADGQQQKKKDAPKSNT